MYIDNDTQLVVKKEDGNHNFNEVFKGSVVDWNIRPVEPNCIVRGATVADNSLVIHISED